MTIADTTAELGAANTTPAVEEAAYLIQHALSDLMRAAAILEGIVAAVIGS